MQRFLRQNLDILAVICLAVVPDVTNCFGPNYELIEFPFTFSHASLIARSLQVALPILLIMQLRGVTWAEYGFKEFSPVADFARAIGLGVVCYLGIAILYNFISDAGVDPDSVDTTNVDSMLRDMSPPGAIGWAFVVASSIANGFAEELALRSYLLTRLKQVSGSSAIAIATTTLMFAAYHTYQGPLGVVNALAVGVVFGIYVDWTGRFWPVAIAHMLLDIVPQVQYANEMYAGAGA